VLSTTRALVSQDLLPCVLVYGVVVWLFVRYRRSARQPGRGLNVAVPLGARLRLVVCTIAGGYVVFAVLAAGVSLLAGESGSYIRDALLGGAVLAFAVVMPLFGAAMVLEFRRTARTGEPLS
jgi:hypothetical protein